MTEHPNSIRAVRDRGIALLSAAGVPSPEVDADLLISHVLGISRGEVQARALTGAGMDVESSQQLGEALERRAAREPLQHITGTAAFRMLELAVGPGVFVPRPETEIVAQFGIDALVAYPGVPRAVDLGTGSGAIALALATEVRHAEVAAVENSPRAFVWAKQNFRAVAADNARLVFIDLADALPEWNATVSVVISNPPYIPLGAIPRDPEVHRYDPEAALFGGEDGLDVVRRVSSSALRLLHPGGTLIIEHGEEQGAAIRALLGADGWSASATHQDLSRRDRVTTALRR
ncbi:MAG: peptide chain release factor N(5)-glutamine methyltransferase [Microbacteriaceae bacterium]